MTTMTTPDAIHPMVEDMHKIVVVGDVAVGKSSLIRRYVHDKYTEHGKPTIGVDFALKRIQYDRNLRISLQLWDVAGDARHGNMTRVFYSGAVAALVAFDVSRPRTLEGAIKWKEDLDTKLGDIPVVLIANKCDLAWSVPYDKEGMDRLCVDNRFSAWFMTSAKSERSAGAKTDCGKVRELDKAFMHLLELVRANEQPDPDGPEPIVLTQAPQSAGWRCCW